MDYEKKYKETLERAKQLLGTSVAFDRFTIERIFPELKESEDEKIRKEFCKDIWTFIPNEKAHKYIAWLEEKNNKSVNLNKLEKQGEQNLIMADSPQLGDQKPTDKFKVGDWVVSGQFVTQIREIAGDGYVNSHNGFIPFESAKNYHLWTIQDAKEGDVLACENGWTCIFKILVNDETFSSYCFMDNTKWFCETGSEYHTLREEFVKAYNGKIHPATKEQCDTLFAKMKEAGYAFNFEEKELKKLGQPEVIKTSDQEEIAEIPFGAKDSELQEAIYNIPKGFHAEIDGDFVVIKKGEKPAAWSKKDEKMFEYALNMIEWYSGKNEDKSRFVSDWLKSIKDRVGCEANCATTKEWSEEDERNMQNISLNLV